MTKWLKCSQKLTKFRKIIAKWENSTIFETTANFAKNLLEDLEKFEQEMWLILQNFHRRVRKENNPINVLYKQRF